MNDAPFDLTGETALVTGGGTGIGLGIARCLHAAGARVAVSGRRADVLEQAVEQIGDGAVAVPADVTDTSAAPDTLAAVESQAGPVSILVNNAGNTIKVPTLELSDDDFSSVIDVHVKGAWALTREAAKGMLSRGSGSVLFVSSLNASIGMPQVTAYSAAKAALTGLVRQLAAEWAAGGVRVNAVVPGWIDAGIAKRVLDEDRERRERVLTRTPMGRLGTAEEVGWAAVYLSSPAAGFVTGTMLNVDGGAAVGF
ncbi:MAG: SDR family NAD(P)-dependent oxidoreductase [Thermoleophilaceae bacterium]